MGPRKEWKAKRTSLVSSDKGWNGGKGHRLRWQGESAKEDPFPSASLGRPRGYCDGKVPSIDRAPTRGYNTRGKQDDLEPGRRQGPR